MEEFFTTLQGCLEWAFLKLVWSTELALQVEREYNSLALKKALMQGQVYACNVRCGYHRQGLSQFDMLVSVTRLTSIRNKAASFSPVHLWSKQLLVK